VVHDLKVKPHEALMVDDRVGNIRAAKKYGLHGLVFNSTAQFKKEIKKYQLV
jgi:FMN phosphatase YigB (HAD superfamily)